MSDADRPLPTSPQPSPQFCEAEGFTPYPWPQIPPDHADSSGFAAFLRIEDGVEKVLAVSMVDSLQGYMDANKHLPRVTHVAFRRATWADDSPLETARLKAKYREKFDNRFSGS